MNVMETNNTEKRWAKRMSIKIGRASCRERV